MAKKGRFPDPIGVSICGLVPEWGTAETADASPDHSAVAIPVLSEAQRRRLATLRKRIRSGAVTEYPIDRRMEFARWLVQHGRISG